jgi:hypothetical protein
MNSKNVIEVQGKFIDTNETYVLRHKGKSFEIYTGIWNTKTVIRNPSAASVVAPGRSQQVRRESGRVH